MSDSIVEVHSSVSKKGKTEAARKISALKASGVDRPKRETEEKPKQEEPKRQPRRPKTPQIESDTDTESDDEIMVVSKKNMKKVTPTPVYKKQEDEPQIDKSHSRYGMKKEPKMAERQSPTVENRPVERVKEQTLRYGKK